ncbi:Leo1-like protein-domain-containing protein [Lipomyces japonicus]|uniref:Leo1-like protein-domain-containing protein n=1 Tax=Lipomyces japonicus TaxID=56871 RepID=UPI0034CFEB01
MSNNLRDQKNDLNGLFDEDEDEISSVNSIAADNNDVEMNDADNLEDRNSFVEDEDEDRRSVGMDEEIDIFGAGSDADEEENTANQTSYLNDYDDEQRQEKPEFEEVDMQEMEITMPRYLARHLAPKKLDLLRVPNFLNVEYPAYEPEKLLEQLDAGESHTAEFRQKLRAELQNTLRWRYTIDDKNQFKIQSNSKIIRWSDGSLSLKLGKEIFNIKEKIIDDTYVAVSYEQHEIVQFQSKINSSFTLVPTSMSSATHLRLSSAITKGQVKTRNVHNIATTEDPEKMKREAEKVEESKIRARKKLDTKRRQKENRYAYNRDASMTGPQKSDNEQDFTGIGGHDVYERDDFVVSDDEDEERERAARLKRVKKQGSNKYRIKSSNEEDEDEEDEEEDDDDLLDDSEEPDDDLEEEARFTDDGELQVPKRGKDLKRRRGSKLLGEEVE